MAPTRGQMLDVELVDASALGAAASDPAPEPGAARRRGAGARRRPWTLVVGVAVAVVLVQAAATVGDRGESARLEALADVPGVVTPMEEPVTELWRSRGWLGSDLRQVDGRLVGAVSTPYRTVDVVALEPRTGAAVWRTPVSRAAVNRLWTRCVVPGAPYRAVPASTTPVVVCAAVDETTTTEQSALGTMTYPTAVRLVVVDAVSGDLLSDAPAAATTKVAALGTDVVLAHVRPDGVAHVVRVDPRTGQERWSFTGPERAPTDSFGQPVVRVLVAGDRVVLEADRVWVLTGEGDVLLSRSREPGAEVAGSVEVMAGGDLLALPVRHDGGGWGTEVIHLDDGRSFTAAGYPVGADVDDGSLGDVVLLQDTDGAQVRAHDLASGRLRWTAPAGGPPIVLGGRVVDVDRGVLRALDGRTGEVAWATTVGRTSRTTLASDGRVVLASLPGVSGRGVLAAFGLDDGRPRWQVDTPYELHLFAVDRQLYGWSERGLVALGG